MIWIGTSGYNYPEWKGSFYPAALPAAKMLPYYAARFPTVEINYTFYRMPNEKLVGGWAAQTPSPYKLTLKAPRRITHDSRLKNCGALVQGFCQVAGTLGDKLGALLFHTEVLVGLRGEIQELKRSAGPGAETWLDVATFKSRYGLSRKYAIPLLEWLDRERVTRRVGDRRLVLG
jgi:hypothetical protein